jgi:PadR family transcriptional regulator PadR
VNENTIKSLTQIAILSLLAESDNYVARLSEILPLNSQTLYSAMKKMETKKLVSSYWQEGAIGGRRHLYSITQTGREYYEQNKVEIDYKMLAMEHQQEKEKTNQKIYIPQENEKIQTAQKIYIPVDISETDPTQNSKNAVNLPLSKRIHNAQGEQQTANQQIAAVAQQPTAITPLSPYSIPPQPTPPTTPFLAATQTTQPSKTPQQIKSKISPYISPTTPIHSTKKQPQQMSIPLKGTLTVDLQPLLKPNSVKTKCGFLLINRLRLAAGIITTVLIAITYLIMSQIIGNSGIYTIGFEALACYIIVISAVWLILPQAKQKLTVGKFIRTRSLISFIAIFTVWAVYLLANTEQNVLGIVPTIFCLIPVIEGIVMLSFSKTQWFVC